MEPTILTALMTLGVGGVIAAIVLMFYRQDRKDSESKWITLTKELVDCRKDETDLKREEIASRIKLAEALGGLKAIIEKLQ